MTPAEREALGLAMGQVDALVEERLEAEERDEMSYSPPVTADPELQP